MVNVSVLCAAFMCGLMLFVSGAPLSPKCQIPDDLNIHYEKLAAATLGDKFFLPAEYITSSVKKTFHRGETTCPQKLPTSGETQDRSTCPWYTNVTIDSTLFPSQRLEAVCRCRDCIASNGMHNCERVYSEMLFLERTSVCVDGLFVYKPVTKHIATGCVCASKKISEDTSHSDYDM